MEAAQLETAGITKTITLAPNISVNPPAPLVQKEHHGNPKFVTASTSKRPKSGNVEVSVEKDASTGVSNCYIFKSRLQEYAQKAGILTPVYETIKEGPSHEPSFRSTVVVNHVRYDSLPGFFNRKAAEQSAAEVALIELASSADMKFGISLPVHETGLCKNLLQEYAQKMNYAIPLYECHPDEKPGKRSMYSCTVEIGGIKYIGASASTKKEAEIKAGRTALLAIQSATSSEHHTNYSIHTVVPHKKKVPDLGISSQETAAALKQKKVRFKKQKWKKKKYAVMKHKSAQSTPTGALEANMNCQIGAESNASGSVTTQLDRGADTLEVNMARQEGLQPNVADAAGSHVETPVKLELAASNAPPVGLCGFTETYTNGFQESDSRLIFVEKAFYSAGTPILENDLVPVHKASWKDGE